VKAFRSKNKKMRTKKLVSYGQAGRRSRVRVQVRSKGRVQRFMLIKRRKNPLYLELKPTLELVKKPLSLLYSYGHLIIIFTLDKLSTSNLIRMKSFIMA